MAERRSIDEALTLPPEKLAFIHGAQAAAQTKARTEDAPKKAAATSKASEGHEVVTPNVQEATTTVPPKRVGRPRRSRSPQKTAQPAPDSGLVGQLLVPLTTRLRPQTAEALRRACLEQKLAGRRPYTQQDIIEAAVRAWLEKCDYLASGVNTHK